jgi:hypothetical protein
MTDSTDPTPAHAGDAKDTGIRHQISALVEREHELRARIAAGEATSDEDRAVLRHVEESLDQCWDLLRQREARRDAGESPDGARVRPVSEVEGYLQ